MTTKINTWMGGDKARAKPRPNLSGATEIKAASGFPLSAIAANSVSHATATTGQAVNSVEGLPSTRGESFCTSSGSSRQADKSGGKDGGQFQQQAQPSKGKEQGVQKCTAGQQGDNQHGKGHYRQCYSIRQAE